MIVRPAFVAVLAGFVAWGAATRVDAETPALTECRLPNFDEPARCGELKVPENPGQPDGRKITIAFAVLPATGGKSLADPIVPLNGGPGELVIGDAGFIAGRFSELRGDRDILLVDQRGIGRSNALPCRLVDSNSPATSLRHFLPLAAVEACARELSSRADLAQYTYLHFAQDLERIRRALGYGPFNLHAGSYGTRAAQVFMRAYPESVRTAYLGSVVPIDEIAPLTMAKAAQAQFEATFAACEADAACRKAYPGLRQEFDAMLARLDVGAARVPVTGNAHAPLGRGRVVEWLRSRLYRPRGASEVPWLIHRANAGDWSPIADGILAQAREVDTAYALGLWLSITCSEDLQFLREEDIVPATKGTYLGDFRVREQATACSAWPKARLPDGYRVPLRTSIPTMFVSGDMDAASPLWFTEHVAPGFIRRVEIIARGQGHTELNDCVDRRYRELVETGEASGIDANCPAIPRPPFRLPETQTVDEHAAGRAIVADIQRIVTPDGVQEEFVATLGGVPQAVSVRGADRANPLLLFVHGGPGAVEMPIAWAFQRPWEDFFTVVQWDQRGAGKSFALSDPNVIAPTLGIDRYRDDAIELIELLRIRYDQPKVFLLGHSWGSAVGLAVAADRPDLLHAYIGMGQIIDMRAGERAGIAWTLGRARILGDVEAVRAIEALAPYPDSGPFTIQQADAWRKWSVRYGALAAGRADANFYTRAPRLSPEYAAADRKAWADGSAFTVTTLWPRLADLSFDEVRSLDVPVILLNGRHDYTTPVPLADVWMRRLQAPSKVAVWFEHSAHLPMIEEPGRVLQALLEHVRPLADP